MLNKATKVILNETLTEDELLMFKVMFPNAELIIETKEMLINKNRKAQQQLAYTLAAPVFAPLKCFSCGHEIFNSKNEEYFKKNHITSCPKCNKSFID